MGQWKTIINNLNELTKEISEHTREALLVITEISKGNFNVGITGNYNGEFNEMKKAINKTVEFLVFYINDISEILKKMPNQDIKIENEYIGNFIEIKNALELIINNFNQMLSYINNSSEQVAVDAKNISDTSLVLADGTSKQLNSVENLNSIISKIGEKININVENTKDANVVASETIDNAKKAIVKCRKCLLL